MRYEISDALLGPGRLTMDVIPRANPKVPSSAWRPRAMCRRMELVWAFGGASGFTQWNLDYVRLLSRSGLAI